MATGGHDIDPESAAVDAGKMHPTPWRPNMNADKIWAVLYGREGLDTLESFEREILINFLQQDDTKFMCKCLYRRRQQIAEHYPISEDRNHVESELCTDVTVGNMLNTLRCDFYTDDYIDFEVRLAEEKVEEAERSVNEAIDEVNEAKAKLSEAREGLEALQREFHTKEETKSRRTAAMSHIVAPLRVALSNFLKEPQRSARENPH